MTIDLNQVTGVILAGGRGTRMGKVDKGLQLLRGKPLALHVLARLAPQTGNVMINANRNISAYEAFGAPVRSDHVTDFAGPLAGLQVALKYCRTEYLVTTPCDTPFLPMDLVTALGEGLIMQNADLAVAVTGANNEKRMQPLFCLLKRSLLANLDRYLDDGGRKVGAWQASLRPAEVHFCDERAFENINTPEELQQFDSVP